MSLCYDFQKWTMITLASIAISLTIGLVTLAYGQETNNFKTYTNKDMKFTIQHPSNWKIDAENEDSVDFTIRENKEESDNIKERLDLDISDSLLDSFFEIMIEQPKSDLNTDTMTLQNTSLDERVKKALYVINYRPSENTLIRQNQITVSGNKGYMIEYRNTNVYADSYIFEVYTIANGKFYILKYVEDPLKVPETFPLAKKMVESFQVIK